MTSIRRQALVGLGVLAVLAAVLIPSGLMMRRALADSGLAACHESLGAAEFVRLADVDACDAARQSFLDTVGGWEAFAKLLVLLPLLAGMWWGVPRAKARLAVPVVLLAASAYALLMTWWLEPLNSGFGYLVFDVHGTAPIGYALFAVAWAILAGTLVRRPLPAMALTVAGFVAVRALVEFAVRPVFLAPKGRTFGLAAAETLNPRSGDWVVSRSVVDAGEPVTFLVYHPGERFWLFQSIETGIFVALAVVGLLIAARRVRQW